MRGLVQEAKYLANRGSEQNSEKRGGGSINRKAQGIFPDWMVQTSALQNE